MENIEIKKPKNKRSIQSLIEESALDSSFNYEAHELRKAFNETILAMNAKNADREKEIEKLKIVLRQYEEYKTKNEARIKKMQEDLALKNHQYTELSSLYKETKQKLQHLEYKLQCLTENRLFLEEDDSREEGIDDGSSKKKMKNEICEEFTRIISRKVEFFTDDIKKISMSQQAERRIESFLQELLYLNPYSQYQVGYQLKQERRQHEEGKIRREVNRGGDDQQEWRMFEKSIEKLKRMNRQHQTLQLHERTQFQNLKDRSISISRRKKLFQ